MRTYEFEYFYFDSQQVGREDSIIIQTDLEGEDAENFARAEAKKLTGFDVKIVTSREII
ncbi:hypothetical protein ACI2LM_13495 [Paenibacillus lautus]|uniref:hypothetical protein n=1 Tax=Paenibacillus lautus TaxID=1401 RepID=UPI00384FC6BC